MSSSNSFYLEINHVLYTQAFAGLLGGNSTEEHLNEIVKVKEDKIKCSDSTALANLSSSPRALSARAVIGRRCPHSSQWGGGRLLAANLADPKSGGYMDVA